MRLVGASNFYVQLPFLVEGMIAGLFGWLVAVGLLAGAKAGLDGLQNYFPFHAQLSDRRPCRGRGRDHAHRPAALRHDLVPDAQALPARLRGQTYTVAATQGKKAQQSGKSQQGKKLVASNRRARHDYTIEDVVEAGIMLTGTEVKSLRAGRATLTEGYGLITDGEVWLHGVHIPQYVQGTWTNHEPRRVRKLLLHRKEIDRLARVDRRRRADARAFVAVLLRWKSQDRTGTGARSANLRQAAGTGTKGRHAGGRTCHAAPKVAQWRLMAGMARRGAHSARHRAGRSRPDAAGADVQRSDLTGRRAWPGQILPGPRPD